MLHKKTTAPFPGRCFTVAVIFGSALLLAATPPPAVSQTRLDSSSSSSDYSSLLSADLDPSPGPGPSPQYGPRRHQSYAYRAPFSHFAVEAGGGFTAPAGNTQKDETYGWSVTGGVGYKFARDSALMAEFHFDRNGIPGPILALVGEPGGNVHTWSLTLDPVLHYKTTGSWGGYLTGGGGFYRKITSFTEPVQAYGEYCDYFYCYPYQYTTDVVVSQYSSNQGGVNFGPGFTFGGGNGGKFYAEARYTWIDTPGRGTQMVPVTFGYRW